MNFKPILFSTPMVQAILAGRKSQTRRIIKWPLKDPNYHLSIGESDSAPPLSYAPIQVGDILWVRETFSPLVTGGPENFNLYAYRADGTDIDGKWKPSLFMPKEAARVCLKVTRVRAERLQAISVHDAAEEGVEYDNIDYGALDGGELIADYTNYMWKDDPNYEDYHFPVFPDPINSFRTLWQSINGADSWDANPWCWVYDFERIEKPKNFLV